MSLLQMSFSGAVFILVIVMVRAVTINRLPKRTFLVLWGIVLLRLLVPVSVSSPVSVYSLLGQNETIRVLNDTFIEDIIPGMLDQKTNTTTAGSLFQTNLEQLSQMEYSQLQLSQTEYPQEQSQAEPSQVQRAFLQQPGTNVQPILAWLIPVWPVSGWLVVWCAGVVLGIAFFTIFYLRWYLRFQTALPVRNDYIEQWLDNHRLERQISVKQSDWIAAPLTYGVLHPVILLPKKTDWENTKQLQYVLLHEYLHIRRFDTVAKIITAIAICIHWFNPFVWVMYILFNRDMELSCDESVVRLSGITSRSDYAHVLIDMEARKSGLMPFYNNFSKNAIEERITSIMKIKKTSLAATVIAAVLIIGLVAVFATSALSADNENTVVELTDEGTMDELTEVNPDDIQMEAQVSEPVFIDCGIELRTDVTGNGLPDQVRVYDNNDILRTSVTLTSANGEEAQFDYDEGLWASSYLVSGDLSGNGAADIVLMRVTNGIHGDGLVSVLHVTKKGAFGELTWQEYSDAFIQNPSINMGQPGTFDDIACVGATVIEQNGRHFLRLVALDMEDSDGDTVQCIDCSLRGNGWYIEEMQTITGYYTENKMEELLRNNIYYLQRDTTDDAASDYNDIKSELLMQDSQYVEVLVERCIWDNIHNIYLGKIENEEIRMIITRAGDSLSAAYITRDGEEKFFNGELDSDLAKVFLNTDDGGYLKGSLGIDDDGFFGISFEGELSGNRVDFTVNWETFFSIGEDTTNYYSFMRYDSEAAEQFAKQIKDSVGNANAFARLIRYPISIELDGDRILIENEKEMIKLYDRLMGENGFRQQVENMYTKYLFANYQGICVEDGIIWFNIDRDEKYKISAINPPRPDDARELEDFMTMFYTAYFNKDRETLQGCFSDSFDGRIDFINEINSVDDIEIIGIKGLDSWISDDAEVILSLEFVFPNEDSYSYLTAGLIKDNGVWKAAWYGLEK